MAKSEQNGRAGLFLMAGCLLIPFFCFCTADNASADTIDLKNGKSLKGLVVEKHADRIILSTENGELPILQSGIKNIEYSDPEQNLMQIGKSYELQSKYGEALAYYEKALDINPDFEEARVAANGVRNKFWAISTQGPAGEMEKQQALYDTWRADQPFAQVIGRQAQAQNGLLAKRLGMSLEKKGDWVCITSAASGKEAAAAGFRKGDRLVSLDGSSLRYLGVELVIQKLLQPRYSAFTLEVERDYYIDRADTSDRDLGLRLAIKYQGVAVESVKDFGSAAVSGVRAQDLIVGVSGLSTRYMPLKQVADAVGDSKKTTVVLTVRRLMSMTRK